MGRSNVKTEIKMEVASSHNELRFKQNVINCVSRMHANFFVAKPFIYILSDDCCYFDPSLKLLKRTFVESNIIRQHLLTNRYSLYEVKL